jgi:hypothetical protein
MERFNLSSSTGEGPNNSLLVENINQRLYHHVLAHIVTDELSPGTRITGSRYNVHRGSRINDKGARLL